MNHDVLVIGAGVAGITAAAYLSELGLDVLLIERGLFPGGRTAGFSCKAVDGCARCNACLLEESLNRAGGEGVPLLTGASAAGLQGGPGNHEVLLDLAPRYIDPERCVNCGLCFEACPEKDLAIKRSPAPLWGPPYAIQAEACQRSSGQDCQACFEACPAGAIDLAAEASRETRSFKAVILAGGYTPFDPALKPRYGYTRLADVITALELDQQLRTQGAPRRPSDQAAPKNLAFIQCVGSRDVKLGRDYCSRVCCGYALRMARQIRGRQPEIKISFFYMDIQNTGRDFYGFYAESGRELELIQGVPGELCAGENNSILVPYMDGSTGERRSREFDLVVLSIGLGPPEDGIVSNLGLDVNRDGFPVSRTHDGLFVAGAAGGPSSIAESRASALEAAARVAAYLKSL